ncbi:unnamed protein product [Dovyalis caffra]|uniref:Dirigent protein n=1 Tax=Dovyalis caffra TaxID=77055 RepID=A0AAV1QYD3_9ROSI|nr:unnamed protein product [Dovyalis caffra]
MEERKILWLALILYMTTAPVYCRYYSRSVPYASSRKKVSKLHFFFHDRISGKNPTSVLIARPNITKDGKSQELPFGSLFAVYDPLTIGPEPTSGVIGHAEGLYVMSSQDVLTLVTYLDFGFTSGKFNGSSISVFSRNPVTEKERELAVVGGRGKLRMARGFVELKTHFTNETASDTIVECHVTVIHH